MGIGIGNIYHDLPTICCVISDGDDLYRDFTSRQRQSGGWFIMQTDDGVSMGIGIGNSQHNIFMICRVCDALNSTQFGGCNQKNSR